MEKVSLSKSSVSFLQCDLMDTDAFLDVSLGFYEEIVLSLQMLRWDKC